MSERQARIFVWIHPSDCDPPHGLDMRTDRDFNKVKSLHSAFLAEGFDPKFPALIGYPNNGRIQLLTGTHRHEAAKRANILLPVSLVLRSDVERTWGTSLWTNTIKDISVLELENAEVPEGPRIPPFDPVDLNEIIWRK